MPRGPNRIAGNEQPTLLPDPANRCASDAAWSEVFRAVVGAYERHRLGLDHPCAAINFLRQHRERLERVWTLFDPGNPRDPDPARAGPAVQLLREVARCCMQCLACLQKEPEQTALAFRRLLGLVAGIEDRLSPRNLSSLGLHDAITLHDYALSKLQRLNRIRHEGNDVDTPLVRAINHHAKELAALHDHLRQLRKDAEKAPTVESMSRVAHAGNASSLLAKQIGKSVASAATTTRNLHDPRYANYTRVLTYLSAIRRTSRSLTLIGREATNARWTAIYSPPRTSPSPVFSPTARRPSLARVGSRARLVPEDAVGPVAANAQLVPEDLARPPLPPARVTFGEVAAQVIPGNFAVGRGRPRYNPDRTRDHIHSMAAWAGAEAATMLASLQAQLGAGPGQAGLRNLVERRTGSRFEEVIGPLRARVQQIRAELARAQRDRASERPADPGAPPTVAQDLWMHLVEALALATRPPEPGLLDGPLPGAQSGQTYGCALTQIIWDVYLNTERLAPTGGAGGAGG